MYRVSPHIVQFALALTAGVVLATFWVNLDAASYYDAVEYRLWAPQVPAAWGLPDPILSAQYITAQGLMALFVALVAKELWESLILPQGALTRGHRAMPTAAVLGGALGAVLVWRLGSFSASPLFDLGPWAGWPTGIGSDVVICYVLGTWAFGKAHPALHLLLLLAAAFDLLGLGAMAVDGAVQDGLRPWWLGLSGLALLAVWRFSSRHARPSATELAHRRAAHLWPYALAGGACWAGIVLAGLPGALGLVPLIPFIPHAGRSFGLFAEAEDILHDPLNRLAHRLAAPVTVALFCVGLTHGGVQGSTLGPLTPRILVALWLGKPLGILAGAWLGLRLSGRPCPKESAALIWRWSLRCSAPGSPCRFWR